MIVGICRRLLAVRRREGGSGGGRSGVARGRCRRAAVTARCVSTCAAVGSSRRQPARIRAERASCPGRRSRSDMSFARDATVVRLCAGSGRSATSRERADARRAGYEVRSEARARVFRTRSPSSRRSGLPRLPPCGHAPLQVVAAAFLASRASECNRRRRALGIRSTAVTSQVVRFLPAAANRLCSRMTASRNPPRMTSCQ